MAANSNSRQFWKLEPPPDVPTLLNQSLAYEAGYRGHLAAVDKMHYERFGDPPHDIYISIK
jgi:hypothetical protein